MNETLTKIIIITRPELKKMKTNKIFFLTCSYDLYITVRHFLRRFSGFKKQTGLSTVGSNIIICLSFDRCCQNSFSFLKEGMETNNIYIRPP